MPSFKRWPRILAASLAALVVLIAVGLLILDSFLLNKVRAQAQDLSRQWGRQIEVGGVSVTLLTGAGARVTGLKVGAAPGEELPLLEVPRLGVKVALLRALFSGGRDVAVTSAEVEGLRLNVVRLPDGTTNVERLQKKMAESRPEPPPPAPGKAPAPSDLSFVRVDRAALLGARVALVDKSGAGSREVVVDHLDVEVKDLRAGRPLDLVVRAAVLAERQNVELRLHAAPLPPTLVPTPDRLVVKVEPVDLAPLAPFLPASVGLRAGRFQADIDAALGAAVPGGSGPTRVQGMAKATGLAFAGQQGGKALDAVFEAEIEGDAEKGNLRIGKLRLDFGPAGLSGRGGATGLTGGSPRLEGLEIVSHDLDPALLALYYPPLRDLASRVAGPIALSLRGSGTAAQQALELRVDLTPVRLSFPNSLAKAAGAKASIVAHLGGAGSGALRFDADVDLAGVDLRPGDSVNKAPGDRLQIMLAGTRRAAAEAKQTTELARVELLLPGGDAVAGKGSATLAGAPGKPTTTFEAELTSSHLDLDRLLMPTPPKKEGSKGPDSKPLRAKAPESKPLDPKAFAGLSGKATVRIGLLRVKKADLRDVQVQIKMQEDEVIVEQGRCGVFGGEAQADGTRLKLAHPAEPFHLAGQAKGVDAAAAVGFFTPQKVLSGRFDGRVDLAGGGPTKGDLTDSLVGTLGGNILGGAFHGKDLVAGVSGPLAKVLPMGLAAKEGKGGATSLGKELPFALKLKNGVAQFEKPLQIARPEANVTVSGGFRLDGSLDLSGTVALSPDTVASITGGRARPQAPIPVTFRLTGPAWSPTLGDLGLAPAVQAIVKEAGTAALGKAIGAPAKDAGKKLEDEAKKGLRGLFR